MTIVNLFFMTTNREQSRSLLLFKLRFYFDKC